MLIDLIKENVFILKKTRSIKHPAETMTDANNIDEVVLLANTPVQAESQLHSMEQAAGDIGLYMNSDKAEFMF